MLGKASEIKQDTVSSNDQDFPAELSGWMIDNPDAEIIDIKFSATAVPDELDRLHALIIYKEV